MDDAHCGLCRPTEDLDVFCAVGDYRIDVAEWGAPMPSVKDRPAARGSDKRITVAAVGDLHVQGTAVRPFRDLFMEMAARADVIALCGDLTDLGTRREAEILAQDLRGCTAAVLAVLGNHDYECGEPEAVVATLREAGVRFLGDCTCEVNGVGFAGVKGFLGGFGSRMLSPFGEPAVKRLVAETMNECMQLESALHGLDSERIVVILHYAPIAATLGGEPPELFPFLGSSCFAETIDRFPAVKAVLHGHAHHGTHLGHTARGVPVYNCAYTVPKDTGRPYALIEV